MSGQLGFDARVLLSQSNVSGINTIIKSDSAAMSSFIRHATNAGDIIIRLSDWGLNEHGVADAGSTTRGRITADFKIAPLFEHLHLNEFGY